MADQAITALPKKTYSGSSQIASTDYLLGIDSAEGYQMLIQDLGEYIINRATASLAGSTQTLASAISALNSNEILSNSLTKTRIPANSDFNSYTTPGVYYVSSDSDAATMTNIPRNSSGKLIVMARHSSGYLAQYYYPSTALYIRYVRYYGSSTWGFWIEEHINYYNNEHKEFDLGIISSASTKTFEEWGLSKYQYGTYFVVLRGDVAPDATWVGVIRHNASGYQVSEIYKGDAAAAPIIGSDGVIKTGTSTGTAFQALVLPIIVWGGLL